MPNAIDAALAAIVLLGLWGGWATGFIQGGLHLLALAASLLLAFLFHGYPEALMQAQGGWLAAWAAPLGLVAVFLVANVLLGAVAQGIVRAVPRAAHAHTANRALGLLPGLANGLVHATVVALLLLAVPLPAGIDAMARQSMSAAALSAPAQWLEAQAVALAEPILATAAQARAPAAAKSGEITKLPFRDANPRARPDLEAQMLALVNAERAQQGLKPLRADPELAEVARAHSRDMLTRGYFSHATPEGGQLGDRMRQAGVRYLTAGENLALAPNLAGAHRGLMQSPGHRANILRGQYGRVGIGVLDAGARGLMVTQNFRN